VFASTKLAEGDGLVSISVAPPTEPNRDDRILRFIELHRHNFALQPCLFKTVFKMTELLDLCYDVLIRILEEIDPPDLAACAQTSWGFNEFIKKNTSLYKAHYLKTFVRLQRNFILKFRSDSYSG
jgi:hypothetical protein